MIDHIIFFLSQLNEYILYFLVFIFSFLDSYIIFAWIFPWTFLLAILAFLSAKWFITWYYVIFFAFLWNLFWSSLSYFLWLKFWKRALKRWFWFFDKWFFEKWINFYNKNHFLAVIFWKLILGIKESISFISWVFHLSFIRFFILSVIWALLWSSIVVFVVYLFSFSFDFAILWLQRVWLFIIILFLIFLFLWIIRYLLIYSGKWAFHIFKKFIKFVFTKLWLDNLNTSKIIYIVVFLSLIYIFVAYLWFIKFTYNNFFINYLDESITHLFFYLRYSILIHIFLFISFFWTFPTIFILSMILSVYLINNKKNNILFAYWLVFLLLTFIIFLTKDILQRPRPLLSVYIENWFSFPSAHAWLSMYFVSVLFYLLFLKQKWWWNKSNIIFSAIIIIFLIWFSRIYLWVHYLSDVLWWWFLWFLWFIFFILLKNYKYKKLNFKLSNIFYYLLSMLLFVFFLFYYKNISFRQVGQVGQDIVNVDNLKSYLENRKNLLYTTTIVWRKTEPINFIFLAKSDNDLIKLFEKSWFKKADKLSLKAIWKLWLAAYDNIFYKNAPFLPLFWDKQVQYLWFQLQDKGNLKHRHHIRIWKTNLKYDWYNIYFASAVYDDDIKWEITHKIDPDLDKEREYFKNKFSWVSVKKINIIWQVKWKNFSYDDFFTDGAIYIVKIN